MNAAVKDLIMRRLASAKNVDIGRAIGHDESHVSRIMSGERGVRISEMDAFFRSLGLHVVELGGDAVTLPAEEVRAMRVLARKGLRLIGGDE